MKRTSYRAVLAIAAILDPVPSQGILHPFKDRIPKLDKQELRWF